MDESHPVWSSAGLFFLPSQTPKWTWSEEEGEGGVVGDEEEGGLRGVKGQKKQGEGVNASSGEGWGRRPPPENE